jgi:hypothetical protein
MADMQFWKFSNSTAVEFRAGYKGEHLGWLPQGLHKTNRITDFTETFAPLKLQTVFIFSYYMNYKEENKRTVNLHLLLLIRAFAFGLPRGSPQV